MRKNLNDRELFLHIVQLIDFLIRLPDLENEEVYEQFKNEDENNKGVIMAGFLETKGIQKGRLEGRLEGLIEGEIKGKTEALISLLEAKHFLTLELKNLILKTSEPHKIEQAFKDFILNESVDNIKMILKK